jgi:YbbR domain-containing protein
MIISVLGSVLIWVMVAYNFDTIIPSTIRNVPVTVNTSDEALTRMGLEPIADNIDFTVDVEVIGSRSTVGNMSPSDIKIEARVNNVSGPGTYELALEVVDSKNRDVEIKGTTPETISLRFDRVITKTLPINLELTGIDIPDGYVMDEESVYPTEVTVTGPSEELANVKSANVTMAFDKPISKSVDRAVEVKLLDSDENTIDSPYFKYDNKEVNVNIPILKKKTVPIKFDFVNVPEDFDTDILDYALSPTEIEVAAPEELLPSLNELHIGYIDMRILAPDVSFFYDVELPDGFISVEGIEDINLRFIPDKFDFKELNIDSESIYVINTSDKYDVTIQSKGISGVTVYGLTEDVEMITAKDLVAQIDMNHVEYKLGQVTVPVELIMPGKTTCWASGVHYSVRATIKNK